MLCFALFIRLSFFLLSLLLEEISSFWREVKGTILGAMLLGLLVAVLLISLSLSVEGIIIIISVVSLWYGRSLTAR